MPRADYFRSTTFRVAATYSTLFLISSAILFGILFALVTREMTREIEKGLIAESQFLLESRVEDAPARFIDAVRSHAAASRSSELLVQLQSTSGQFLAGNVTGYPAFSDWRTLEIKGARNDDDDEPARALALGVSVDGMYLMVGRNLILVHETQELILRSALWMLGVLVLLALVGGGILSRGAVHRIEAINQAFEDIAEGNLARRVPVSGIRDDIDHLGANINDMLDRVETLMQNLQQVTNNIAHDLRTPLGRLRQGLELARERGASAPEYEDAIDKALAQTDSVLDTFGAILRIAQVESGARRRRFTTVDLSSIANLIVETYESVFEDAGQNLSGQITPDVGVHGDKDLLTQMMSNLVENASRHCPPGTSLTVILTGDPAPTLTIADNGPGIPQADRQLVFQRFHRLDESRSTSGSGLGLSLVKAIVELHGATIELVDANPGLRVITRFER